MKRATTVLLLFSVALLAPCVRASESPDAKINPQTGGIEIADPVWSGDNYDIRFIVADEDRSRAFDVTAHPADDLRPRMAFAPGGDAYIVWWRDGATPQVLLRKHAWADDTWADERVLSGAGRSGGDPEIVHDGNAPWVAFGEGGTTGETVIRVGAIEDAPDPFGSACDVASTDFTGDLELGIQFASGHLWVTWTDSDSEVAWSEYDHASSTWSGVDFESYALDGTKEARQRIRNTVLGN